MRSSVSRYAWSMFPSGDVLDTRLLLEKRRVSARQVAIFHDHAGGAGRANALDPDLKILLLGEFPQDLHALCVEIVAVLDPDDRQPRVHGGRDRRAEQHLLGPARLI